MFASDLIARLQQRKRRSYSRLASVIFDSRTVPEANSRTFPIFPGRPARYEIIVAPIVDPIRAQLRTPVDELKH